jgi:hypothetical protein
MKPVHEQLAEIDARLLEARKQHREVQADRQGALQAAAEADDALVTAEAKFAAGQIEENAVKEARKRASECKSDADWDRRVEVAARTVSVLEQERGAFITSNLRELEGRIKAEQDKLEQQVETHTTSAAECVGKLHDLNNQRGALRRAIGLDTRDLPSFQKYEELRRLLRKRAQAEAGVA